MLADGSLTVLKDPKGLFLASHAVPVASTKINQRDAAAVINKVSAALDAKDLIEMNRQSTVEAQSASAIASKWLESKACRTSKRLAAQVRCFRCTSKAGTSRLLWLFRVRLRALAVIVRGRLCGSGAASSSLNAT